MMNQMEFIIRRNEFRISTSVGNPIVWDTYTTTDMTTKEALRARPLRETSVREWARSGTRVYCVVRELSYVRGVFPLVPKAALTSRELTRTRNGKGVRAAGGPRPQTD